MISKRLPILLFMLFLLSVTARADFTGLDGVTYIEITGDGFAADTLDGVEALYNVSDSAYQCTEYVRRYYDQVYGVAVDFSVGYPESLTEGYDFVQTDETPKTGDIAFLPAYARDKGYGHWAIVKSCQDGQVTLIEQNWRWSGMAAYERQISWPSDGYIFYVLTNGASQSFPSAWAKSYVEKAEALGIGAAFANYRKPATRLEFCRLLTAALEALDPNIVQSSDIYLFPDTLDGSASKAAGLGLVDFSGPFRPDDPITRQEAAGMLDNALDLFGLRSEAPGLPEACADGDAIGLEYLNAVENMLDLGFLLLDENGCCNSGESIEIQHAIVLVMYLYNYAYDYVETAATAEPDTEASDNPAPLPFQASSE